MRNYKKCVKAWKRIVCNLEMMQVLAEKSAKVAKEEVGDLALRRVLINLGKKCAAASEEARHGLECDASWASAEEVE